MSATILINRPSGFQCKICLASLFECLLVQCILALYGDYRFIPCMSFPGEQNYIVEVLVAASKYFIAFNVKLFPLSTLQFLIRSLLGFGIHLLIFFTLLLVFPHHMCEIICIDCSLIHLYRV